MKIISFCSLFIWEKEFLRLIFTINIDELMINRINLDFYRNPRFHFSPLVWFFFLFLSFLSCSRLVSWFIGLFYFVCFFPSLWVFSVCYIWFGQVSTDIQRISVIMKVVWENNFDNVFGWRKLNKWNLHIKVFCLLMY